MKIALASDHGGYLLKEDVKSYLSEKGYEVVDCGTNSLESCNYPVYARLASKKVSSGECEFGFVICTTGEGVSITANKEKGIRCGIGFNEDVIHLLREHNNCNMMAMGAKYTTSEEAHKYIDIFLSTPFAGGRHQIRVDLIEEK
ncbi:MAG: ribose 5-phosphate isomerase B [Bacilli bacterium]